MGGVYGDADTEGVFGAFLIDVGLFFPDCAADPVGVPEYSRRSDPGLLVGRPLRMTVVVASFLHHCCSFFRSVLWQCHIWS